MTPRQRHTGDLLFAVGIAVVLIPLAIVWTSSITAGLIATGRPVSLTIWEALAVAVAIPSHLANTTAAWPSGERHALGGAIVLDITLLVCALAVLTVLALAAAAAARHLHHRDRQRAAKWAGSGELAALHTDAPVLGRITLGEHEQQLVAAEPRASVMLVGPAQSGKTTGVVVPAVIEWHGPVLSTSVKADVVHDTHLARAACGDIYIFDPTGSTRLPHTAWSPLDAARTWQAARRTAASLLNVGEPGAHRSPDETFWRPAGAAYLAPLLLAAAQANESMSTVLRWIATEAKDEPTALLKGMADDGATVGLETLHSIWNAEPRFRSNLTQTVTTALDAWREPAIARATAGENAIRSRRLLEGSHTLYLIAPAHEQRRLRGLFTALVADVVNTAYDASASTGKPINPPLLLALDEVANIAPLPNLDEIASTGPGQGVQLLTVLQNISQADDRWGRDRAQTIIANHRARLFCSGIGDRATLDYLKDTLGDEEINRVSLTRENALARGSRTYSSDFRSLAAPHRVRQADTNSALLVYGNLPPAWLALRPWYANEHLNQLVRYGSTPPPPPPLTRRPFAIAARAVASFTRSKTATPATWASESTVPVAAADSDPSCPSTGDRL